MNEKEQIVKKILNAASKHPNSKVAQCIRNVEDECNSKNIVLLLVEVANHSEYAVDFDIPLQYYMELFSGLLKRDEASFNETGVFLSNTTLIYARRVDFVNSCMQQISVRLSSEQNTNAQNTQNGESTEDVTKGAAVSKQPENKATRGNKRHIEESRNLYEVELAPKKFRKLTAERRFVTTNDVLQQEVKSNNNNNRYLMEADQYVHPTGWLHSTIVDFENAEDVDTKRNYKLFSYHIERRYNTLVPDINFRLHFMMKDYIDAGDERHDEDTDDDKLNDERDEIQVGVDAAAIKATASQQEWPPLSDNYVQRYLTLENQLLQLDELPLNNRDRCASMASPSVQYLSQSNSVATLSNSNIKETSLITTSVDASIVSTDEESNRSLTQTDSGIESSLNDTPTLGLDISSSSRSRSPNAIDPSNDTGVGDLSVSHESTTHEKDTAGDKEKAMEEKQAGTSPVVAPPVVVEEVEDKRVRVHLPHLDDEGVYFSDLDEHDQRMLSPTVVACDVLPCIPNKENVRIIVDDAIRTMLNIPDDDDDDDNVAITNDVPLINCVTATSATTDYPIKYNILQIHERFLRKRLLFKPGPELELFIKARSLKRSRGEMAAETRAAKQLKLDVPEGFVLDRGALVAEEGRRAREARAAEELDAAQRFMTPIDPDFGLEFYGFVSDDDCISETGELAGFDELGVAVAVAAPRDSDGQLVVQSARTLSRDSGVSIEVACARLPTLDVIAEEDTIPEPEPGAGIDSSAAAAAASAAPADATLPTSDSLTDSSAAVPIEAVEVPDKAVSASSDHDLPGPHLPDISTEELHLSQLDERETLESEEARERRIRIQKWHEHLAPHLAKAHQRSFFDVYQLGTEIISTLQQSTSRTAENKPCASFAEVMQGKPKGCLARYFLSSLLLVNQNNIRISVPNKSCAQVSMPKEIQLELHSTVRHSVPIEDNIGLWNESQQQQKETLLPPPPPPPQPSSTKPPATPAFARVPKFGTSTPLSTVPFPMMNGSSANVSGIFANSTMQHYNNSKVDDSGDAYGDNGRFEAILSNVRPLMHIEKVRQIGDDLDSGISSLGSQDTDVSQRHLQ